MVLGNELKNQFLVRGIIPKVNESQCLIGMPLNNDKVDEEILLASINIFQKLLLPKIDKMVEKYSSIEFGDKYL